MRSLRRNGYGKWQSNPQTRARAVVNMRLRRGKLHKQPCEECAKQNIFNMEVEAHHDDYSKPSEVRWLCGKHHKEADKLRETMRDIA